MLTSASCHGERRNLIGKIVSHYRVLSELGRGGMGIVDQAEDTLLGRRAALKFLPDDVAHEPQALARFQREARSASALNHPNICTIYEIGEQDQRWFIAMELLEGIPLDSALAAARVSPEQISELGRSRSPMHSMQRTTAALSIGIRSPRMFSLPSEARSRCWTSVWQKWPTGIDPASTSPATATFASPLTSPGTALGTVAFMSPEQARATISMPVPICFLSEQFSTRWRQGDPPSTARLRP